MEPVICNLGAIAPDRAFVTEAQNLCRRYGTLFIADEVACAFERTGKLFASQHFDLEPDLLCLAKAMTGGYARWAPPSRRKRWRTRWRTAATIRPMAGTHAASPPRWRTPAISSVTSAKSKTTWRSRAATSAS